jgi:hypothetical protein
MIGGGGAKNAQSATPKDLQGQRGSNIGLLNYLLGFNQPGAPWNPQQSQAPQQQQQPQGQWGSPGQHGGGNAGPTPWPNVNRGSIPQGGQSPWPGVNGGQQGMTIGQGVRGAVGGAMGGGQWTGNPGYDGSRDPSSGGPMPNLLPLLNIGNGILPGRGGQSQGGGGGLPDAAGGAASGMMGMFGGGPSNVLQTVQGQMLPGGGPTMHGSPVAGGGPAATHFQTAAYGQQPGGGFNSQLPQAPPGNDMLGRMESYFGPLGTPTTALQQQSLGGISQFLNSNPYGQSNDALSGIMGGGAYGESNQAYRDLAGANPFGAAQNTFGKAGGAYGDVKNTNYFGGAQGAFNQLQNGQYYGGAENQFNQLGSYNPFGAAQSSMEGILGKNPGMQGMEALRPLLDRNLAAANQEGGRFGSANAILRSRAVDDNNLLASQMWQHGVDQQVAAAGQYQGLLGIGNGRMQQQSNAAQGLLGVGQGRLDQGLGVANGLLGIGQGQVGIGNGRVNQMLGAANGLSGNVQSQQQQALNAANGMATNQNTMFNNLQGGYNTGQSQANQEAQRQQQALNILLGQLGVSQQATLGGPTVVQPTGAQQGVQVGGDVGALLAQIYGNGGGRSSGIVQGEWDDGARSSGGRDLA